MNKTNKFHGLYYTAYDMKSGNWDNLTEIGDSSVLFFNYLLRSWIQSNFTDSEARHMYYSAIDAIKENLVMRSHSGIE